MSMLSSQCENLRKKADELADKGTFVGSGGCVMGDALMLDSAFAMREAADTIEELQDKLEDADVAYNDAEVLGDVTQGLFRDLMAADPDTAKMWARSWPELLGEKAVGSESYGQVPEQAKCENGGERESYDTGFSSGVKACLQQLDGLIHEGADVDEMCAFCERGWYECYPVESTIEGCSYMELGVEWAEGRDMLTFGTIGGGSRVSACDSARCADGS